jgi:hypothetical protein
MADERSGQGPQPLDAISLLRVQAEEVHRKLDTSFTEWLGGLPLASRPPRSEPVEVYVHAATIEDIAINALLLGVAPLFATEWAGRGPALYSTLELAPIQEYARQVFAATEAYLAALTPSMANDIVDLSRLGLGFPSVGWVVSRFVILELAQLTGELAAAVQASKAAGR